MSQPDRISVSVAFKIQVFQYEPVEVGGSYETTVQPGESPEAAFDRAHKLVDSVCQQKLVETANNLRKMRGNTR